MKYRNAMLKYSLFAKDGDDGGSSGAGEAGESGDAEASAADGVAETSTEASAEATVVPTWPEDWLSKMSDGDEKAANMLGRYDSPAAVGKALIDAQKKIRSGALKTALPEKPTEDELAAWRKENGIPEKPSDYKLEFDSGLVIGEEDKPMIESFLETAHKGNVTPEQAKKTIEWYYQEQERMIEERKLLDEEHRVEATDALNQEWGGDFRRNINMIEGLLNRFPENVRDLVKNGRLADGRGIFNSPDAMKGFAALALELNPAGIVVPGNSESQMKGIDEEISKIEETMRTNRTKYNKDEKMQARYRELLAAREKVSARKSA